MPSVSQRVGRTIQRLRERRGLTQEGLAAKAGISRGYVARVETGRHDLPLSTLVRLAKALGVGAEELVR